MKFIFRSIKGVNKTENQDNLLIIDDNLFNLFAVFDGVGSASNSKKGTEIAKRFVEKNYKKYIDNEVVSIDKLMYLCNEYILSSNVEEPYTTYCMVIIFKDSSGRMIYSSMGDTRIYEITNQYIEQITDDDRMVNYRNVITKCLGLDSLKEEDFTQKFLSKINGNILVCSDGFYNILENDRMKFFSYFNRRDINAIRSNIDSEISDKNLDDSTYVFIR